MLIIAGPYINARASICVKHTCNAALNLPVTSSHLTAGSVVTCGLSGLHRPDGESRIMAWKCVCITRPPQAVGQLHLFQAPSRPRKRQKKTMNFSSFSSFCNFRLLAEKLHAGYLQRTEFDHEGFFCFVLIETIAWVEASRAMTL